jgi:hypothetical protein
MVTKGEKTRSENKSGLVSHQNEKRMILDSETLLTDFLSSEVKSARATTLQIRLYELTITDAASIREYMSQTTDPTAEDIMIVCRKILTFGLTQKALAAWFGVATGTLSRWVSGENPPRDFMRVPIFQELERIMDYIVGRLESHRVGPPQSSTSRRTGGGRIRVVKQ